MSFADQRDKVYCKPFVICLESQLVESCIVKEKCKFKH